MQVHEAEEVAIYNPCHHYREHREAEFEHRAPRLAALYVPLATLTSCYGTRGGDARDEVDEYEGCGRAYECGDGAEESSQRAHYATNILEQYLHL